MVEHSPKILAREEKATTTIFVIYRVDQFLSWVKNCVFY